MSVYTYKQILEKAKTCQTNVKKEYKTGISSHWCYYFGSAILNPKKNIKKINIGDAPTPKGTSISRQIKQSDYKNICEDLTKFVQNPKYQRLPNYVKYGKFQLTPHLLTEFTSRILVWYDKNGRLPTEANINSKVFNKPVETGNAVYDYFVKKTGKKFNTLDDLLAYVKSYFKYQKYFDDVKSNKQVTDTKSGNCTDLLQWLMNMTKAMGYKSRCIHVKCRTSGTGHVFGEFNHPKHTGGKWIRRDIAAVADGGNIRDIWCSNGYVQGVNPSWFVANLNR